MKKLFDKQKRFFGTRETFPYEFRRKQLLTLREMIVENEEAIKEALKKDLNKSSFEAYTTEIGFVLYSLRKTLKNLRKWMKPKKVKTPIFHTFTKSYVRREPLGTVLIIGPYNYPFQLMLDPLIGAIAAGNTAILKPSEFPSHTEALMKKILNETFDEEYVHVVTGEKETTKALLELPFDHVFFTGSPRVGQIVYEAASKHLTPVTLELGGKSPAIVAADANLKVAARRIVFGKFLNAGQTCIAPDYLYVDERVKERFVELLKETIEQFYRDEKDAFPRIINDRHFERIQSLVDTSKVVYGNHTNAKQRYMSPTLMVDVTFDDAIMREEIFGPVLPVLTYKSIEEARGKLERLEKPLALYVFSSDKKTQEYFMHNLSFGGGAINDTVMHVANPYLPFGGVGQSGIGAYHGKYTFDTFSHTKSYMKKSTRLDPKLPYPPFKNKEKLVKKLMR